MIYNYLNSPNNFTALYTLHWNVWSVYSVKNKSCRLYHWTQLGQKRTFYTGEKDRPRWGSKPQPSVPKTDALHFSKIHALLLSHLIMLSEKKLQNEK